MQKVLFITCSLLASLNLLGCQQTIFDVPVTQWNQLTPPERAQIIDGYNQRQQLATQNAPVLAAIGATASVLTDKNAMALLNAPTSAQSIVNAKSSTTYSP